MAFTGRLHLRDEFAGRVQRVHHVQYLAPLPEYRVFLRLDAQQRWLAGLQFLKCQIHGGHGIAEPLIAVQQLAVADDRGQPHLKWMQDAGIEVFQAQDLVEPARQLAFVAHQPRIVELAVGQFVHGAAGEGVEIHKPFGLRVFRQPAFRHPVKIVQVQAFTGEIAFLFVRRRGLDDRTRHDLQAQVDFFVGPAVAAILQFLAHLVQREHHAAPPFLRVEIAVVLASRYFPQHVFDEFLVRAGIIAGDAAVAVFDPGRLDRRLKLPAPVVECNVVQLRESPGLAPFVLLLPRDGIARDAVPQVEDVGQRVPLLVGIA